MIIATNLKTGETLEFDLIKQAAAHARVARSSMTYRLKNNVTDKEGWTYTEKKLSERELKKRKRMLEMQRAETKGIYSNSEIQKQKFMAKPNHISYQRNSFGVCITQCPFFGHPKPMIGSAKCQRCPFFEGMNRELQEVSCIKKSLLKQSIKK